MTVLSTIKYSIIHDEKNLEVYGIYGEKGEIVVGSKRKYYEGKTAKLTERNKHAAINATGIWLEGFEAGRALMAGMF